MCSVPFSANAVLSGLKDFQRRTVDYVFERFYGDDPTSRFLVADEVGLGKTLVAKGIIAKTLEHLQGKVDRIDVVYLCSNAAIASQNISRLNINGGYSLSTRLTYLPTQLTDLEKSKVNFVSLTPGTAFDQDRQRGGHVEERVIINLMLQDLPTSFTNKSRHFRNGLLNAMQGRLEYREKWREMAENSSKTPDKKLSKQFCQAVLRDQHLSDLLLDVSERFGRFRGNVPHEDNDIRYELIKNLRKKLSSVCISLLEPDLVILDEFQRFKHLLDENNEASNIARELFEYPNVRVLLISATPYKMFTLNHEQDEDDHYPDFIRTLKFLFNNNVHKVNEINNLLSVQRENIFSGSDVSPSIPDTTKVELERALLKVMCRTERVLTTQDRNAMLQENTQILPLEAEDICRAASLDSVAVSVGAGDQTEYWKSAPYLLNFLKDYELRNKLDNRLRNPSEEIRSALNTILSHSLSADSLTHYQALETSNPKMSALYEDTIDKGMWQLLWMPPSLPYMKPGKIYSGKESLTKELVFSSWKAVPNAIAAVLSYQAERKMVAVTHVRHNELYDRIGQLLQFSISRDGRLGGMPVVGWLYPSPTLATVIDPLKIAISQGRGPLSAEEMKEEVRVICRRLIETLPEPVRGGRPDERWYWVAPILLDRDKGVIDWCRREDGWLAVIPKNKKGSQD
ncbi:MAG: helicase, partial [Deltaproteobacteria bacterium]|nr:helicase [Deltaproteobacteria bacterium]